HFHPAFKKEIDFHSLQRYFQFGYIAAPGSIFKQVQKLSPGHVLELNLSSRSVKMIRYWDVGHEYSLPRLSVSFTEAATAAEKIIESSLNYCRDVDPASGVLLTGGYESACVAALLGKQSTEKVNTYTVALSESDWPLAQAAKAIAKHLGASHEEIRCPENA